MSMHVYCDCGELKPWMYWQCLHCGLPGDPYPNEPPEVYEARTKFARLDWEWRRRATVVERRERIDIVSNPDGAADDPRLPHNRLPE